MLHDRPSAVSRLALNTCNNFLLWKSKSCLFRVGLRFKEHNRRLDALIGMPLLVNSDFQNPGEFNHEIFLPFGSSWCIAGKSIRRRTCCQ